jgi:hypothetical protein
MSMTSVRWRNSLEAAQREAREQAKLVLIDLFNPG